MVELIAKNTVKRRLDGKYVLHAPNTRFEMSVDQAAELVRLGAAFFCDDVSPFQTTVNPTVISEPSSDDDAIKASDVAPATASEPAITADQTEAKTKRSRKSKIDTETAKDTE